MNGDIDVHIKITRKQLEDYLGRRLTDQEWIECSNVIFVHKNINAELFFLAAALKFNEDED